MTVNPGAGQFTDHGPAITDATGALVCGSG
jgi:hypothetical protein